MEQGKLLTDIAKILKKLSIPYVVTGSFALAVWGRPRYTADIDVVIELLPEKLNELADALLDIDKDVYLDRDAMREALERHGEFNFIHPASGLKVDFWVLKNKPYSREQIKRGKPKKINGQDVRFISAEDLVLSKLIWYKNSHSERQLEDIESVLKIQKKLDTNYLKKWAQSQSTLELLEPLLKANQK